MQMKQLVPEVALLLVFLALTCPAARSVTIDPDTDPITVPYNGSDPILVQLPFTYSSKPFTVVKTAPGCSPEQVSVTYFGADSSGKISMLISWATCDATVQSSPLSGNCTGSSANGPVTGPLSTTGVASTVYYGPSNGGVYKWSSQKTADVNYYYHKWPKKVAYGAATSYVYDYSSLGSIKYASPMLHHVLVTGLQPGVSYDYVILDNIMSASPTFTQTAKLSKKNWGRAPFVGTFKVPGVYKGPPYWAAKATAEARAALRASGVQDTSKLADTAAALGGSVTPSTWGKWPPGKPQLPSQFPIKVAVIGDPGQTYNTTDTLRHVMGANADMLWILGDLAYADLTNLPGVVPPGCNPTGMATYQPRWDTFGRLLQPLVSKIPVLTTLGNHEIEILPGWAAPYTMNFTARNLAYNQRYPGAQNGPSNGPTSFGGALPQPNAPANATSPGVPSPGAYANMYYKAEIPGVATTIWISSYSPYDVNGFSTQSEQYVWLKKILEAVDRKKTPWLIVNWHAPMYNTYVEHFKENECFRQVYEPLLLKHSADIIILGHVHAYERIKPVRDYKVDTTGCAPMHITIGDAGTLGGLDNTFISATAVSSHLNCSNPEAYAPPHYQPQQCLTFNQGPGSGCASDTTPCFCFTKQPSWSAYRQPSFGHGQLVFLSETKATWTWYRNEDQMAKASDAVTITRIPSCSA